ncbi:hypothetical protein MJC1_00292 [Methylocystis sp. MJC1]|jgi:hypothetical protein|nr:hypothetical protein MJC1_00292 [Methylocystis sp. MJC1]
MSYRILSRLRLRAVVPSAIALLISVTGALSAQPNRNFERHTNETTSARHYAGQCDSNERAPHREPPRYGDDRDFECFMFDEY